MNHVSVPITRSEVTITSMRRLPTFARRSLFALILALIVVVSFVNGGCGCGPTAHPPAEYSAIVSTFTISTIALQTDDPDHVPEYLDKMTNIASEEPAGWANRGLFY